MLEISSNKFNAHLTIFPKTFVFLEKFKLENFLNLILSQSTKFDFFPILKSRERFLKKCLVICSEEASFFHSNLTVSQNLSVLHSFFKDKHLKNISLKQFQLNENILGKYFSDLTAEEVCLLNLTPIFLKNSPLVFVSIDDTYFSDISLSIVKNTLISKLSNSNSIIFYKTLSGNSLNFDKEIIIKNSLDIANNSFI